MLSDPVPKSSRRDFFDSEAEIGGQVPLVARNPSPGPQPLYGSRHEARDPEPQAAEAPF